MMNANKSVTAGVLAAIGASVCCVGPLVLLMLGISGGWISSLGALEPYRPVFIGFTLLSFGLAFRKLYLVPRACAVGTPCADESSLTRQRIIFWIAVVSMSGLLAVPALAPLFI